MLNWMYHNPTIEEVPVSSAGEAIASCLPSAELTTALPVAIAAKLSPQEAYAPALSTIVTAAHITSFVQVSAKMIFIVLLLFDFEPFEQGGEKSYSPSTRSRPYLCLARKFPQCKLDHDRNIFATRSK